MAGEFDRSFLRYMKEYCVDQVIILGHINPDGDAAGSVMGLAHYIRYNYPEYRVIPYLANTMDKGPKRMVLEDTLFDPFQKPKINGKYAVIVCDSARVERIVGAEYLEGAHFTILIDHHLWNARYCDVNYVMESEACAHNVYDLVDNEKIAKAACESYPNVADYLYLGILHDTSCFARANEELLLVASKLLGMGVDHKHVAKTLHVQTKKELDKRNQLFSMARRALGDKVAYVYLDNKTATDHGYTWEDIHPISSELRNCDDIELAFTMYEEMPDVWRISSRSDGRWVNVNDLLNPLGGGGHAGAAGMMKKTDKPELLLEAILKQAEAMIKQKENVG